MKLKMQMPFWQRFNLATTKDGHWTRNAANSVELSSTQPILLKATQYYFQIVSKSYTLSTSKKFIFQMSVKYSCFSQSYSMLNSSQLIHFPVLKILID